MNFDQKLQTDRHQMAEMLGYWQQAPDEVSQKETERAAALLEQTATPRWIYHQFRLERTMVQPVGIQLQGKDIAAHLTDCESCAFLALTLGAGVEHALRNAGASNMSQAVMLDVAASVLVEQYADLAEETLRDKIEAQGQFLTGRFSPGYGDFPLALQADILRLLDAPKAIGLTTNNSSLLLPRKSITAVLGVASKPVKGKLAGCAGCALQDKCSFKKEGKTCADFI